MPYTMHDYVRQLAMHDDHWTANWVEPYTQAYTRAWASFKTTLDNQRKADQLRAAIALSVLSIGLGAGLGAAFGATAMRTVAANQAIRSISRTNSIRLMRAANWVAENPTRSFIAEQAWDTVAGLLNDRVKTTFQELAETNPAASAFGEDDGIVGSVLREHLARTMGAARSMAEDIISNDSIQEEQKNAIAGRLQEAAIANPPTRRPPSMAVGGSAQLDMELAMFMAVVMEKDFMETSELVDSGVLIGGGMRSFRRTSRTPISQLTTQTTGNNQYPTPGNNQRVVYENVGSHLESRINTIFRQRNYGRAFFYGDMGREEIQLAERTLTTISRRYSVTRLGPSQ